MRDVVLLLVHLIVTVVRLARPGGLRGVVAESVLVKHQLLILQRGRKRAPNLRPADRIIVALCTLFLRPARLLRSAIVLKPSTFLRLHNLLRKRKYRLLFSPKRGHRGRVEDWRPCSVGSAYPLRPVSVGSALLSEP